MKMFRKTVIDVSQLKWRILAIVIFMFMLSPLSVQAQDEGRIWYFGNYAGLSFNTDPPTPLTDGQLTTNEGCATICDSSGNLLFYTNGITVWNSNHTVMPNGTGLMGNPSSTQSAIIVPDPGDPDKYYVFEVTAYEAGGSNVYYSKVDMNLDGGLGDVETTGKSTLLMLGTEESITAVASSDATFWWIIVHERGTSNWHAFRLTSSGVQTGSPVITSVGTVTQAAGDVGQLKANPAGSRVAIAYYIQGYAETFDFDNATGVVSNPVYLPMSGIYSAYGTEFSPNGNLLYISDSSGIYQYDLLAGSESQIQSSQYTVTSASNRWALQSAPDGKLYSAVSGATSLDVIDSPNTYGAGCGYAANAQAIGGTCSLGLPNIIASLVSTGPPVLDNLGHANVTATSATLMADVVSDGGEPITARGFYYDVNPNPTINQTLVSGTVGSMSADISGLTPGTLYYYRAFATNSNGTASIGDGTFTTTATGAPVVDNLAHANVTGSSATLSADVISDGGETITARGFYYDTNPNPTVNQTLVAGTIGSMSANISGLTPNTTYYYRAFATNINGTASIGDGTFTTPDQTLEITISGYVSASGAGLAGVELSFSNYGGTAWTDASGYYRETVSNGWSGMVTPNKSGYAFSPQSRSYQNVESSQVNQDYTAHTLGLSLQAVRLTDYAWIIERDYAEVTVQVANSGGIEVSSYVLYRKVDDGDFVAVDEVPGSGLQNNTYFHRDVFIEKDKSYTYRLSAINSSGVVAISNSETI